MPALARRTTLGLTVDETAAVRRAFAWMRVRLGGYSALSVALGCHSGTLANLGSRRGKPGLMLALRLARLAEVPIEAILAGEWPNEGACPHCGRV